MQIPLALRAREDTNRISEASESEAYRHGFDGLDHGLVYFEEEVKAQSTTMHESTELRQGEEEDSSLAEEQPPDPALLL